MDLWIELISTLGTHGVDVVSGQGIVNGISCQFQSLCDIFWRELYVLFLQMIQGLVEAIQRGQQITHQGVVGDPKFPILLAIKAFEAPVMFVTQFANGLVMGVA